MTRNFTINTEKLKAARKELRYSTEEISRKLNIHRTTYSAWERGIRVPSFAKLKLLAELLNCSVNDISDLNISESVNLQSVESSGTIAELAKQDNLQKIDDLQLTLSKIKKDMSNSYLTINALLSLNSSIIILKDPSLNYIIVNKSFRDLFKITDEYSIADKTDFDFFSKSEAQENIRQDNKILVSKKAVTNIEGFIPGTKKKKWGLISKIPILDNNGKVEGILTSFIDITERKKNENMRLLLESNINQINDAVFVRRYNDNNYIYLNSAVEKIYGYPTDLFYRNAGKIFWIENCIFPEDAQRERKYIKNNEWPVSRTIRILRPDNQIRWIEIKTTVTKVENNKYITSVHRDITDALSNETRVDKFKDVITTSDEVLWIAEYKSIKDKIEISYISDNVEQLFGITPKELLKDYQKLFDIVYEYDLEKLKECFNSQIFPKEIDFRIIHNNTKKWIKTKIFLHSEIYCGSFQDISNQKDITLKNHLLKNALSNLGEVVWVIDSNAKCILLEGAKEKLYGSSLITTENAMEFWQNTVLDKSCYKKNDEIIETFLEEVEKFKAQNHSPAFKFTIPKPWVYKIRKPNGREAYIETIFSYMIIDDEPYALAIDREIDGEINN